MKFSEIVKILGIRALLDKFSNDLFQIRQFLIIELNKKPKEDMSRYMRDIKKIMAKEIDISISKYKPNVLEVIKQVYN